MLIIFEGHSSEITPTSFYSSLGVGLKDVHVVASGNAQLNTCRVIVIPWKSYCCCKLDER